MSEEYKPNLNTLNFISKIKDSDYGASFIMKG
jgi:hypothetical protein